jgi:two-component system nitrogen regulation response regulator NtrX
MKRQRVLVVDDEPGIRGSLSGVLEDEGYEVESVPDGESCLTTLRERPFDVVLLDVWLPGIDGMETLVRIQEIPHSDRPMVVMISGHGTIETAVRATQARGLRLRGKAADHRQGSGAGEERMPAAKAGAELERLKEGGGKLRIIGESVP